ncbi:hypothetical protein [Lysinibacillus sp. SGAir0095]|uniref:hypothetical protein n=1 Tax=Lysinibacillus sp. SGAir0095 TaxID=2070463 RepID=UPI0010CCD2BF|nr:hypothetical protein [Lysinibacillus sp. SGAir0095]QCR32782.1 hypothetical protein C1N55_11630 [Lysinibacillus sp. SGAir0095]
MTWERLHKEQEELFLKLMKIEKMQSQIETLTHQITQTGCEIQTYDEELKNLKAKLEQLDSFSFVNLIRSWTGKQEELREQKIDKAASLELKLIEAIQMKNDLSEDLLEKNNEISKYNEEKIKNQLEMIKVKKELWLKEHQPNIALALEQLEEDELNCKKLKIEIDEAKIAGNDAINKLHDVIASLESASTYSTWDTFLGGGFIATHLKHEKINESESKMHQAQIALQRFKNELLDIQNISTNHLTVNTDGFVKFADYVFDDIFSAWSIHSKISSSKEHVSKVIADVRNTMLKLEKKLGLLEEKLNEIELKKKDILEI